VPIEVPEAAEITEVSGVLVPVELLATLGRDRVRANESVFDPPVIKRLLSIWDVTGDAYARIAWRRRELVAIARAKMDGFDAWISPTAPYPTPRVASVTTMEQHADWNTRSSRCTRPGNLFDQCGISLPMANPNGPPFGLQLCAANGSDEELIAVAAAVESVIGAGKRPDLSRLI